jgi:hypothetical protein
MRGVGASGLGRLAGLAGRSRHRGPAAGCGPRTSPLGGPFVGYGGGYRRGARARRRGDCREELLMRRTDSRLGERPDRGARHGSETRVRSDGARGGDAEPSAPHLVGAERIRGESVSLDSLLARKPFMISTPLCALLGRPSERRSVRRVGRVPRLPDGPGLPTLSRPRRAACGRRSPSASGRISARRHRAPPPRSVPPRAGGGGCRSPSGRPSTRRSFRRRRGTSRW